MDALKKVFQIEIKKEDIDEDANTLTAAVSSERRDRDEEIIRLNKDSVDLEGYRKNPVLLWQHRPDSPIGRAQWIKVDNKKLLAKFEFHKKTQLSKEIFELYKTGFLNSFSIGFKPKVKRDANNAYRKIELLEVSAVSVPSNTDAITMNGYGEKITDNILRKDLNLEACCSGFDEKATELFKDSLGLKNLSPERLAEMAKDGVVKALDDLRNRVQGKDVARKPKEKSLSFEKNEREIEVDLIMLKKIIREQITATFKGTDIKKMIEDKVRAKTKENMTVAMGKLLGRVF